MTTELPKPQNQFKSLHLADSKILINYFSQIKSESQEDYLRIYNKFCEEAPKSFIDYYNENWHNIRNEWTKYNVKAFGNYTNNRCESINADYKRIFPKNAKLGKFLHTFFKWHRNRITNKQDNTRGMKILRQPTAVFEGDVQLYQVLITEYAFDRYLKQEYMLRSPMTLKNVDDVGKTCAISYKRGILKVSVDSCTCLTFQNLKLPCRHIFALREHFQISIYSESLCDKHCHRKIKNLSTAANLQNTPKINLVQVETPTHENKQQRKKIVGSITDDICDELSKLKGEEFWRFINELKKLQYAARQRMPFSVNLENGNLNESFSNLNLSCEELDAQTLQVPVSAKRPGRISKKEARCYIKYTE